MPDPYWESFACQQQADEMDAWVDHQIDLTRDLIAEGLLPEPGADEE